MEVRGAHAGGRPAPPDGNVSIRQASSAHPLLSQPRRASTTKFTSSTAFRATPAFIEPQRIGTTEVLGDRRWRRLIACAAPVRRLHHDDRCAYRRTSVVKVTGLRSAFERSKMIDILICRRRIRDYHPRGSRRQFICQCLDGFRRPCVSRSKSSSRLTDTIRSICSSRPLPSISLPRPVR